MKPSIRISKSMMNDNQLLNRQNFYHKQIFPILLTQMRIKSHRSRCRYNVTLRIKARGTFSLLICSKYR